MQNSEFCSLTSPRFLSRPEKETGLLRVARSNSIQSVLTPEILAISTIFFLK